jgi:hypothetical protein
MKIILSILISLILVTTLIFFKNQLFVWPSIKEKLLDNLTDPNSALFKNEKQSGKYICGEINAKNTFGGYTGYKKFIAHKKGFIIEGDRDVDFDEPVSSAKLKLEAIQNIANKNDELMFNSYVFQSYHKKICQI